jgi:hypothetical protein
MREVYAAAGGAVDLRIRCEAAQLLFPEAIVCRETAAALLNLPVDDDGLIHLDRGPRAPRSERPQIKTHRYGIAEANVHDLRGLRVADGPCILAHLADELDLEALVVLGDVVLRRWGQAAIDQAVAAHGRRRGAVLLRQAVPLLDPGSASPPETRSRVRLRAAGFTRMEHKVVVRDDDGGWLAELDLGDEVAKVGLQHEGLIHFEKGAKQRRRDAVRDELSRMHDWTLVSTFAQDDADPALLIAKVTAAYHQAGRLHGPGVLPACLR